MPTRKIERTALAALALAASVALIGAGVAGAHAPGANRGLSGLPPLPESIPSMPQPNFNPSTPYSAAFERDPRFADKSGFGVLIKSGPELIELSGKYV
jgi:hypothetical protein